MSASAASDLKQHWEKRYSSDPSASSFSWTQAEPSVSLRLARAVLSDADAEVHILDIGGGASAFGSMVAADGPSTQSRHVRIVDLSAQALGVSAARLGASLVDGKAVVETQRGSVSFEAGDVLEHAFPEGRAALWHDRAVFHFLTAPSDQRRYILQARGALRADGHVVLATFDADGGPLKCSGLDVRRWSADELGATWGEHGFCLVASAKEDHVTPGGATQKFVYVLLQRGA